MRPLAIRLPLAYLPPPFTYRLLPRRSGRGSFTHHERHVEWSDAIEKGKTDKATVTQKLRESLAVCTAVYQNTGANIGGLMANVAHTNLHYGNIITYLRMLGLVPPTS